MTKQIRNEVKIMYKMYHKNIIKMINHFEDNQNVYLILEYASGGQLWQLLHKRKKFKEKTVKKIAKELCEALHYIHSLNPPIIHRDIKPENIILDKKGTAKLADFGWSNFINSRDIR